MKTNHLSEQVLDLPNFESISAPLRRYLEELDSFLNEQVFLMEPEVQEQVRYVLTHSGKRLRPILVGFSGWHQGLENDLKLIRLGAILELVHLATLVHDDILDEANIRHGSPTVASKYGKDAAVLVGDVLFAHALCLASDYDTNDVCRSVAQATGRVCSGEIAQTYSKKKLNFNRNHYYRIIKLKTAELFAVACSLGAKVSGKSDCKSEALYSFGIHFGCAYQIYDDVVDIYGKEAEAGKTLGTDLVNGKFTLPVLIMLESMNKEARRTWINSYESGNTKDALQKLNSIMDSNSVISNVRTEFYLSVNKAKDSLSGLPAEEKKYLFVLVKFLEGLYKSFI